MAFVHRPKDPKDRIDDLSDIVKDQVKGPDTKEWKVVHGRKGRMQKKG